MSDSLSVLTPLLRGYTALDDTQLGESTVPIKVAQGLANGDWKLIEIVKGLQDSLTSENDQLRTRGVGLLSAVVQNMDKSTLDRQSTKVLTTFFTTKLCDKPSLVPCATALSELTKSPGFGTLEGIEVVKGIFGSVSLKQHAQSVRHKVYVLLDDLMSNSRPALVRLGQEFLTGYCQLVEGEKDPRNLMISFGLVRVMLLEFDIQPVVEELFDITFCYFPITFTPPADDPYGITSRDLIESLRNCLSANPLFGPLALPLFLDKLQAASEKAKRQTLEALSVCFPIYGAATCGEWAGRFSEALSIEVFHATETSIQDLALVTFNALFKTLYPDHDHQLRQEEEEEEEEEDEIMKNGDAREEGVIRGIAVQVVKNSLDELDEPEKSNAKPAMRILVSLAAASNRLARYVIDQVLPRLLRICQNPDEMALRPPALTHIATLLASLTPTEEEEEDEEEEEELVTAGLPRSLSPPTIDFSSSSSPLEPHLDTLLSLFTSCSRSQPCRIPALRGLISMIKLPGFLSVQEIEFCVSSFNEIISASTTATEEEYDSTLSNLIIVSKLYPRVIETLTLPLLFSSLPCPSSTSTSTSTSTMTIPEDYQRTLSALAALSLSPDLFEILSMRISSRLEQTLVLPSSSSSSNATLYAHHLLSTLRSVIQAKINTGTKRQGGGGGKSRTDYSRDLPKYLTNGFFVNLLKMFILPTLPLLRQEEEDKVVVALDLRLLVDLGKVLGLVLQTVEPDKQGQFFTVFDRAFRNSSGGGAGGGLEGLLGTGTTLGRENVFDPFSSSSPLAQRNLVSLYTAVLVPLSPLVPLEPPSKLCSVLNLLLEQSLETTNELQLLASLHGLSNLVNKRIGGRRGQEGETVETFLDGPVKEFWKENVEKESSCSDGPTKRRKALRVWTWIAKGLIVRSDAKGYEMVEKLLGLFEDRELGRDAARQLGVIAEDHDRVLSKENGSVIRLLYKQRFFTFLLPKLVAAHKDQQERQRTQGAESSASSSADPAVYLIALSSLLQHLPKQLTLTELPKLLPLLITSLELPDPSLRSNVIDTLGILVKEVPDALEPSISSIAMKTIKSAVASPSPASSSPGSIKLRLSSLEFLSLLPSHIPYLTLHPQKTVVLKELGRAIDDPKRQVRRAAVECRSRWFSYN